MELRLKNKIAVITGSGRGIGAATAKLLAQAGAKVVLVSRTKKEIEAVAREIGNINGKAFSYPCDVSDEKSVSQLFQAVEKKWGYVDILINNAAILIKGTLIDQKVSDWDKVVAVNLRGPFLCSRQAFKHMKASKKGGCIVNVSSLSGIRGVEKFPGMASYVSTKHGLIGLTESLAVEGKEFGIRANVIAPGAVATEMLKKNSPHLKTKTTPEDIAKSILFFCDDSQSKHLSGSVLEIFSNE